MLATVPVPEPLLTTTLPLAAWWACRAPSRYHSWSEHDPAIHELEEHLHAPPPPLVVRVFARARGHSRVSPGPLPCALATWHASWCWYHPLHPGRLACGSAPPLRLLQTDLNGDGKPEVITATPSGKIQILAPRRFGDGFAKAEVRRRRLARPAPPQLRLITGRAACKHQLGLW